MTQAIVKSEAGTLAPGEWQAMREQAKALVSSGFLPKAINTPEKAITLAMAGRELGLGMMQAIRSLHIIDGKPVMSADLMAALVHRNVAGAMLRVETSDNEECVVVAARNGGKPTRFAFSLEDAKRAGLTNKDNWRKYPRAMLRARCLAEAVRATFPDALFGVYHPDELGAITTEDGEVVEINPSPPRIRATTDAVPVEEQATDTPAILEAIGAADSLDELRDIGPKTPAELERYAEDDQSAIGKAWRRRERQLKKAAKPVETEAADPMDEVM